MQNGLRETATVQKVIWLFPEHNESQYRGICLNPDQLRLTERVYSAYRVTIVNAATVNVSWYNSGTAFFPDPFFKGTVY